MSEVYYVERDGNGAVVAVYGMPQPGITDPEPLPETDPEVAAILNPPAPPPEPQTLEDYRAAIRAHVDATAQTRDYDNAVSCASYVNSTNPTWADEASAFVAWREAALQEPWSLPHYEEGETPVEVFHRPQK